MPVIATDTVRIPRTLLVAIHAPYNKTKNIESYYEEFLHLISSNNIVYHEIIYIKLRSVDPGYFVTKGKLEELVELCKEKNIENVIFSEILSGMQERNLSEMLSRNIFDRTQIILEIFEKSAHSGEGKMQVSIAMYQHQKSRVAGKGIHMHQQEGRVGAKGPGETAKERELQHYESQINKFKRQLKELEQVRETQRKKRLNNETPHICLVGYTNTGKSTLLNQLTKANVLVEDRLFATLDTTTRELYINSAKKGVISDTVGFIQQLPTKLIEAFKSTLSEIKYADLLLHVVDISDLNAEDHIEIVNKILHEINADKPTLYVFNKKDLIDKNPDAQNLLERYQPHVLVSGKSKDELKALIDYLDQWNKNI